jgi:hypothetical protein
MGRLNNVLTRLSANNTIILTNHASFAAFISTFSWIAYKNGCSTPTYEIYHFWNVDYKIMVVIFHILGYSASKFYGIKFCPELNKEKRWFWMILFPSAAQIFLVIFGAIPPPYNSLIMLLNGISLAQQFGLIFSYLEGRKITALLACALNIASIAGSGIVKSIGQGYVLAGINRFWVPALIRFTFYVPLHLSVFLLESLPEPNEDDQQQRVKRVAMDESQRMKFLLFFLPGVIVMTLYYMLLQGFIDFRDSFSVNIFIGLGYGNAPNVYSQTETIVGFCVIIPVILLMLIKIHFGIFSLTMCYSLVQ